MDHIVSDLSRHLDRKMVEQIMHLFQVQSRYAMNIFLLLLLFKSLGIVEIGELRSVELLESELVFVKQRVSLIFKNVQLNLGI